MSTCKRVDQQRITSHLCPNNNNNYNQQNTIEPTANVNFQTNNISLINVNMLSITADTNQAFPQSIVYEARVLLYLGHIHRFNL